MKVLVVKLSALGDILHAMPAVRRLLLSGREVGWMADVRYAQVLELFPGLAARHLVDPKGWGRMVRSMRLASAFRGARASLEEVRALRYDVALDLQGLIKSALLGRLAGAGTFVGMRGEACREPASALFYGRRVAVDLDRPVKDQIMRIVAEGAEVPEDPADPGLVVPDEAQAAADGLTAGTPPFVLVAGAGWPTKVLPVGTWREVARALAERGAVIVLSGSEEERARAGAIVDGIGGARVVHRLDLPVLAGVLGRARVVIGGDTGLVHLAAALGTPTVSYYGPSLGSRSGPVGDRHRWIQSEAECSPCFRRRCGNIVCFDGTFSGRIVRAVSEVQH